MEYDEYNYYNYTETWEEEDYYHSPPLLRTVLFSLVTAIALLANVFLLVVLCSAPSHFNITSNVIFLQRAIANLFSSTAMVFFTAAPAAPVIMVSGTCITFSVLLHVGSVASNVLLMAFTVDNYVAERPQQYTHLLRLKTIRMATALAWVLSAAAGIAAIIFTTMLGRGCFLGPFFSLSNFHIKAIEVFVMYLVPLIVTWVLVSVALRSSSNSFSAETTEQGEKGSNRSLMLALTSTFTVTHGLYWIYDITLYYLGYFDGWLITFYYFILTLPTMCDALSPILVIYLTENLRQKVAGWLSSRRRSTSLPLGELFIEVYNITTSDNCSVHVRVELRAVEKHKGTDFLGMLKENCKNNR
ncbi:hypothetical protein E2C01_055363 [Portunus trituberculatus]|uniref:G-protein coupled receptors family 1 profile domain-containing protein n=1 Tax=Portunus trituberculatus TaxID=210409 RepID=A0A5B7GXI0_PORTR|nr:hypothetical protein [Portunus trituberculatus]